ncbi:succinylglutamate desuccinylase/aspartoacylase family protein [Thalassotalea sp. LPB0316]|uniref:succinylglutamate desuccinylase/aspartoacylase domain-containing protein n=1 Tax=Thalassotalea sp. LPB0316 TaxID=2769490 RepID=UPI0018687C7E|nr:succinylglutamate desuccinylase/aspartoacylase family protein [Thalassotalea sp. LPB0316]QOL26956.1 succinylglutamate desuccinylase/aspartoacylase family protein [Thalassotalea sp. LPB0316]
MAIDFSDVCYLENPDNITLKADYKQFLLSLCSPTVIDITCPDSDQWYVITTLLHGNEPSGFIALHQWLNQRPWQNKVNLRFIICSVEAAQATPLFSHRFLPGGKDINRCFNHQENREYYLRANIIEQAIRQVSPVLVVDMHNTSGSSPAFCVSSHMTKQHLKLASFFCDNVILSHIALGALMEIDIDCPVITLECGGCQDIQANKVAFDAIAILANSVDLTLSHKQAIKVIHHPMRLQLAKDTDLVFALEDKGDDGVTIIENITQFNYGVCRAGQILGWLDHMGLENLVLIDENQNNVIDDYFYFEDSRLIAACDFQIFMATTDIAIAQSDCLFYITA